MALESGLYKIQLTADPTLQIGIGENSLVTSAEGAVFTVSKTFQGWYVMTTPNPVNIFPPQTLFMEADGKKVVTSGEPSVTVWVISEVKEAGSYVIALYSWSPLPNVGETYWTVTDLKDNQPVTLHTTKIPGKHQGFTFVPVKDEK